MSIQSVQVLNTKQCMYKNIIRSTNHLDLLSSQKLNKTFSFFLAQWRSEEVILQVCTFFKGRDVFEVASWQLQSPWPLHQAGFRDKPEENKTKGQPEGQQE